ncbi:Calcium-transporting P-type ATPase, N-terminal autoinhibitory domain [Sesbania bispinosa]|nr:Calcium-transporting P-type ATPase, N-terminal autoinhibitory domain [Sesbania bispinosa]
MEKYLRENFHVQPKRPSEAALRRWRSAVAVVKNPRRRFRMVANLAQRAEAEKKRTKLQVLISSTKSLSSFFRFSLFTAGSDNN